MILCFFGKLCLANLTFAQQQHRPTRQARAGNKCGNMNRGDFWINKPTEIFFGLKQNPCEEGGRQKQYLWWWWWWWLDRISRCQHSVLVAVSPRVSPLTAQRPHHPADTQIEFVASISTFYSRSRYYLWRYILVLLSVPRHPTSISLEPRYIYIHTFEESWLDLLDF